MNYMENNLIDIHIKAHQKAIAKLREAKLQEQELHYHLATKLKAGKTNSYLERLINGKLQLIEAILNNYDSVVSDLLPDETKVNNPIFERYAIV